MKSTCLAVALVTGWSWLSQLAAAETVEWVKPGSDGKLVYKTTPTGDRIADFSFAGYGGGGVQLPTAPAVRLVSPSVEDDSAAIQSAIDLVSGLPMTNGFRGAVVLAAGRFHCSQPIKIARDGIVLRGSGADTNGTMIEMTGAPHVCIALAGERTRLPKEASGAVHPITDAYVPAGSVSLCVKSAEGLKVGDSVLIRWPATEAWIQFMGMDNLVRNGKKQTWIKTGSTLAFERTLRAIDGNRLALDVPLSDAIAARFLAPETAVVVKITQPIRLAQCGVEALQILSPPPAGTLTQRNNGGMLLDTCEDCWVKDVTMRDTLNNVTVGTDARRITLRDLRAVHTATVEKGAGYPADFLLKGSQILLDRCVSSGDGSFYVATLDSGASLNVVLYCEFYGHGSIQPHMRWSTGLLVDCCRLPEGRIEFVNRKTAGSGHGWAIGWAVAWNCAAKTMDIQQPPGALNWCIGCSGEISRNGAQPINWLSSPGAPVAPASLYRAQLRERLGPQAVANLGD